MESGKGGLFRGFEGRGMNPKRFGRDFSFGNTTNTLPDEPLVSQLMDRYELIGVAVIASIGIPFNILCIYVLCKRIKKSVDIYKIFIGFNVLATVNVFVLLLIASNRLVSEYFPQYRRILTSYTAAQRYLVMFFDKSLSSLVILISLNRLLVLFKPLKCQQYVIVKHVGKVATGLVITMSLLVLPLMLDDKSPRPSSGQDNTKTAAGHYMTVMTVFFGIINCFALIIINAMLTLQYSNIVRKRAALSPTITMNNARIIHLGAAIGLSAIYLLNAVPQSILETLEITKSRRFGEHAEVFTQANQISFIMKAFSAACYGPLFLVTSKENRKQLVHVLPFFRCWNDTSQTTLSTHTTDTLKFRPTGTCIHE